MRLYTTSQTSYLVISQQTLVDSHQQRQTAVKALVTVTGGPEWSV